MLPYIYKITCLKGSFKNHYYIGKRKPRNQSEKYYGSGKLILKYYKKYGAVEGKTIIKEILEYNPDQITNSLRECQIIGDKWQTDPLCLNLKQGGSGGRPKGLKLKEKTLNKLKGKKAWNKGKKMDPSIGKQHSEALKSSGKLAGANNPHSQGVIQLSLDGTIIKQWDYMNEAMLKTGIKNISAVCRGLRTQAGGFKWEYV